MNNSRTGNGNFEQRNVGSELARGLSLPEQVSDGADVLTGRDVQQIGQSVIRGEVAQEGRTMTAARELDEAALEVSEDQNRLENAGEFVGMQTELQVQEQQVADEENLRNELSPHRDSEAKIVHRSQEAIAGATMREVDAITRGKSFEPLAVLSVLREERLKMLNSFENPYKFGSNN